MIALLIILALVIWAGSVMDSNRRARYWAREWRVYYPNGERTVLLGYSEAKGLVDCFGGHMSHEGNGS